MTPGHPVLLTSSGYGLVLQKGQDECVCLTFKVSPEKQGGQPQPPRPPRAVRWLALDASGKGSPVGVLAGLGKGNETMRPRELGPCCLWKNSSLWKPSPWGARMYRRCHSVSSPSPSKITTDLCFPVPSAPKPRDNLILPILCGRAADLPLKRIIDSTYMSACRLWQDVAHPQWGLLHLYPEWKRLGTMYQTPTPTPYSDYSPLQPAMPLTFRSGSPLPTLQIYNFNLLRSAFPYMDFIHILMRL